MRVSWHWPLGSSCGESEQPNYIQVRDLRSHLTWHNRFDSIPRHPYIGRPMETIHFLRQQVLELRSYFTIKAFK